MPIYPLTRRGFLAGSSAGIAAASVDLHAGVGRTLDVFDLRALQVLAPRGVDVAKPSLSWSFTAAQGHSVNAYRVRVASSEALLRVDRADLWDSGWRSENAPIGAIYAGTELRSRQRCYWTVSLRTDKGNAATSEPGFWEMGLLNPRDWSADWLAAEDGDERADREAAPIWVSGSATVQQARSFKLSFQSEHGQLLFTLAVDGVIHSVSLDGATLALPFFDPHAFGGRPAARFTMPISKGAHVLEVELSTVPGYFTKPEVALAGQLRLTESGRIRRISGGWLTTSSEASGSALWQAAKPLAAQPFFPWPATPARLLRRRFHIDGPAKDARLYVAALGGYEVWINGARVGDAALQPDQCDFGRHVPYRIHDITSLLRSGDNVIAAMVSDGWYASYVAPVGRYAFGPAPRRLLLQLEADVDGKTLLVGTDEHWRSASSALHYSEIYGGEDWNFHHDLPGWQKLEFDDSRWAGAKDAPAPQVPLTAKIAPPVKIIRQLQPVSTRRVAEDRFIVDFGQNFAGRVRLELSRVGPGAITVRHAELLDDKGELDRRNLRAARAEDSYRFSAAAGPVVLEPKFTYQGFRYVEVSGLKQLGADEIKGLVLSSGLQETGLLKVDHPLLQKIWSNTVWSQRANFVGVPTDCPQRDERLGWAGDAQIFWDAAAFNMDVGAFTREWLQEFRAAQGENGNFPLWAPMPEAAAFGPPQSTPGWADAGVMLPYVSYLRYGDRTVVDENWTAMQSYVQSVLRANPAGLWEKERGADFGDWLSVDAKSPADETTPKTLVATAMLARSIEQLAALASWTGRETEATALRDQHERVRNAFASAFVRPNGAVGNSSQTSFILALALDLVPEALRSVAAAALVADIRKRGTALSTGFLGTPLALDALAEAGHEDVAIDLLLRSDYPSWGHMISKGATTMWERWNGDSGDVAMNSYNHYAFGAVCGFLYRRVAGIAPLSPGFAKTRIAPIFDRRIGRVSGRYDSVRGRISVDLQPTKGGFTLDVSLPSGVTAEILLPAGRSATITSSAGKSNGSVTALGPTSFRAGPGQHHFSVNSSSRLLGAGR